jgi:hypothetical protein
VIITTIILIGSLALRLMRPIDAGLLVGGLWLATVPVQSLFLADRLQFTGVARDELYFSIAIANLMFAGFQWFLESALMARLRAQVVRLAPGPGSTQAIDSNVRYWFAALLVISVGLAVLHLVLMPSIPVLQMFQGSDEHQLQLARENSAKLLHVPGLIKYMFTWNSRILLPILLIVAVLYRWRWAALFVGLFGLFYIIAPLEKLPAALFVAGPFIAIAVRDGKRVWSPIVIAGLFAGLLTAYGISQVLGIESRLHPVPASTPGSVSTVTPPRLSPISPASNGFSTLPAPVRGAIDLVLRRIGEGPADVNYRWFAYFPQHHPFLYGSGWEPWRVLQSGYQSPANMVGLWAYYGTQAYSVSSISAYASFIGDGWAEFGYAGVVIASLFLFGFMVLLELMRAFTDRRFCLACYAPALLLLAAAAPEAGLMALLFSLGISLAPFICLVYLLSSGAAFPLGRQARLAEQGSLR